MIKQEAATTGLPLTPNYNTTRGFYIQLNINGQDKVTENLPSNFIKVVKAKNVISCTTDDLVS